MAGFSLDALEGDHPGQPSGFSCPDCNGVLWEMQTEGLRRYRCRVGHAWSPGSLLIQQSEALEAARLVRNLLLDRGSLASAWPPAIDRQPTEPPPSTAETDG